ncbi:MAG: GNAT family N-acetyltransferase [Candidatus Acidiferrales bacterium]
MKRCAAKEAHTFAVCVRDVQPTDRARLSELYEQFEPRGGFLGLPPRTDAGGWLDRLAECPAVLAEKEGQAVAHGVLCPQGDAAEIVVFVHQDHRSRGLGRRLMQALLDRARELGIRRAWGITERDNLRMLRLVRSLGFLPGTEMDVFELGLHPPHPRQLGPEREPGNVLRQERKAA